MPGESPRDRTSIGMIAARTVWGGAVAISVAVVAGAVTVGALVYTVSCTETTADGDTRPRGP
ncbi:hypothetical protein [Nocardia donostiensis]|uniref:Uncharacterized protein n=1 Tax=Nocardia donostiensis TaxID=1538463 RepID=A0A1V2TFN7_9NOCA|nr:hypothetical protein [Nocardia donostiensis]ONM48191.1 hypothetical protein B0T46_14525 [Nocardia donostiensis]OQS17693.1 hypothetical protein B0T44_23515 [Nocardia donostiensis]